MEARDRRPVRPAPGDRGAWSHGPVSRLSARPVDETVGTSSAPVREPVAPVRRPLPAVPPPRSYLTPGITRPGAPPNRGFGLPSLRRNVCPHFYMTGSRGAIPIQAPHLLKGLLRQPTNISRCQLRGGVHLDESYVNDVCLTPRFNQCVFYEDELTRE
ncbi:MAG: hypothetical protein WCK58_10600 [Chloroflexota bacterium]